MIIGQAPGKKVHETGLPWNDKSGDKLREWLGIDKKAFYNPSLIAHAPMAFCYPGKDKNGDLPPPPICSLTWHEEIRNQCSDVQLTILIGHYSQNYYLKSGKTLTENVRLWKKFLPEFFPLPHPSPRNFMWYRRNPWFEKEVIPNLRQTIKEIISFDSE